MIRNDIVRWHVAGSSCVNMAGIPTSKLFFSEVWVPGNRVIFFGTLHAGSPVANKVRSFSTFSSLFHRNIQSGHLKTPARRKAALGRALFHHLVIPFSLGYLEHRFCFRDE